MPIPTPNSGERENEFIQRCMGDGVMTTEFPDTSQRRAVCQTQWEQRNMSAKWFKFTDQADGSHEVLIMDEIGINGVTAKEFIGELNKIPGGRQITVGINSGGGDVFEGLAIYNALNRRKNVTTRIDGIAASIASVIAMAGEEVQAPENTMLMIHDPSGMTIGTSKDHQKTAQALDKIRDQIAGVYELKTGMETETIKQRMADETWYTARQAKDEGFVDTVTEASDDAVVLIQGVDLKNFRNAPVSAEGDAKPKADQSAKRKPDMNETNQADLPLVDPPKTTEQVENKATEAPKPAVDSKIKNELAQQAKELEELKKDRAGRLVDEAVEAGKITAEDRDTWISDAVEDFAKAQRLLGSIKGSVGSDPVSIGRAIARGTSIQEMQAIASLASRRKFYAQNREEVHESLAATVKSFRGVRDPIQQFRNANTLGGMWTTVISAAAVDYLGASFAPLNAISKNFLPQGASAGDGVTTRIASAISAQAIKTAGYAAIDATSTAVSVTFTVNNNVSIGIDDVDNAFSGGPRMFRDTFVEPMVEGLSQPIWDAIWTLVVAANYSSNTVSTAANFDADVLADVSAALSAAKCPRQNRSAILPPDYYAGVGKTSVVSDASAYGSTDPIRELVVPRARGFAMYEVSAVPDNSENLGAVCLHQSAMAAAARVPLNPEQPGGQVQNVVDPVSMIPMQFRTWYDWTTGLHMFSVANLFGVAVAQGAALERITTA